MENEATPVRVVEGQQPIPVTLPDVPIEVTMPNPPEPRVVTDIRGKISLAPETTAQEDIVAAGQRKVTLIWEATQSIIVVAITLAVIATAILRIESFNLTNAFFLIVGFYFSRVNQATTGGVGRKPPLGPYVGR